MLYTIEVQTFWGDLDWEPMIYVGPYEKEENALADIEKIRKIDDGSCIPGLSTTSSPEMRDPADLVDVETEGDLFAFLSGEEVY